VINQLDCSPDAAGWPDAFASTFLQLNRSELEVLKDWLLQICEYPAYKSSGLAASGPGDTLGRAFNTLDRLEREVERKRAGGA
jgi:hypothetical protein